MSAIDDFLLGLENDKRQALERIRDIALELLPGAEEVISYGMPTLKYHGVPILGFNSHKNHIGIYPFSGDILRHITELSTYSTTPGALRLPLDKPLPKQLLQKIVTARLQQAKLK